MACGTWIYITQHQGQDGLKLVLYGQIQKFQGLQLIKLEKGFYLVQIKEIG